MSSFRRSSSKTFQIPRSGLSKTLQIPRTDLSKTFQIPRTGLSKTFQIPRTGLMLRILQVVEPIVLSKNEPEHDIKEATIMQQATLTQQRKRVSLVLDFVTLIFLMI